MVGVCAIVAVGCGGRVADESSHPGLSGASSRSGNPGSTTKPGSSTKPGGSGSSANPGSSTNSGSGSATGTAGAFNDPSPSGTAVSTPPSTGVGQIGVAGSPSSSGPPTTGVGDPPPSESASGASIGEVDGGPIYYTLGGVTRDGHLLAAYWTGSEERVVFVDPKTGASTFAGNLCDLYLWEGQFTYDEARGLAYAVGRNRAGQTGLYRLSLEIEVCTGIVLSNAELDGGGFHDTFAGVSPNGRIVAAHWDGKVEAVVLIDPFTGVSTFVGNMGDLYLWQGQFTYDDARNTAYAIGQDRAGATHLYSLSLSTGVSSQVDVDPAEADGGTIGYYIFGGTTPDGHIVAAYWNGLVEQTVLIDPATGRSSLVGHLGDLYMWQGQLLYGKHTGVVYAIGQDRSGARHFYLLPLAQ